MNKDELRSMTIKYIEEEYPEQICGLYNRIIKMNSVGLKKVCYSADDERLKVKIKTLFTLLGYTVSVGDDEDLCIEWDD